MLHGQMHAAWTGACSMDMDTQQEHGHEYGHGHGHGHGQWTRHGHRLLLDRRGQWITVIRGYCREYVSES
jgi:hypothetical protein